MSYGWLLLIFYIFIVILSICSLHFGFWPFKFFSKKSNGERIIPNYRWWLTLVLILEFASLAGFFWLIIYFTDCLIDAERERDLLSYVQDYGIVFFWLCMLYITIILFCGIKYWLLSRGHNNADNPHFRIDDKIFTKDLSWVDWVMFSAQNMFPAGYSDVVPKSRIARLFTVGATLGGIVITVLLVAVIVLTIS